MLAKKRPRTCTAFLAALALGWAAVLSGNPGLAETAAPESEPSQAHPAGPPLVGTRAILSRLPDTAPAAAGKGIAIADVESSLLYLDYWDPEESERRRGILNHAIAVRAILEESAPGAALPLASFRDDDEDVVRYVREKEADIVVMAFGSPARMEKEKWRPPEPRGRGLADFGAFVGVPLRRHDSPSLHYSYARTLAEERDTVFVKSIGNDGEPMPRDGLSWQISGISNGVAAVWVDAEGRIHPQSDRCGPHWRTHMCIAVYGTMRFADGAGAPYRKDGEFAHGSSVAAARLAAGLALLKQWLRDAKGRADVRAEELLQIACNTARLGPNTHEEVGCGILDLDAASRSYEWAASRRLVTQTVDPEEFDPLLSAIAAARRNRLEDGWTAVRAPGFDTLNPYAGGIRAKDAHIIYDTLTYSSYDGGRGLEERGLIAESFTVDERKRSIDFLLREEARWHDGAPIAADDVVWTAETLMARGRPAFAEYFFDGVVRVEKTGPRSVRFVFRRLPYPAPLTVSRVGAMPVLPKHFWEGRDFGEPLTDMPLGSGPYRFSAVALGKSVVYEPVPDYWARDFEGRRPAAERRMLKYRYVPEREPA